MQLANTPIKQDYVLKAESDKIIVLCKEESDMKKRLEDMISYVFGKYDMRTGIDNKIRMEKLLQFCLGDIESHPGLEAIFDDNDKLEFFVIQSIIYMMR